MMSAEPIMSKCSMRKCASVSVRAAFRIGDWRFNVDAIDSWCLKKEKPDDA